MRTAKSTESFVIPAQAGLRRQDAEANIGCTADGPKGELQEQFVIHLNRQKSVASDDFGWTLCRGDE